MDSCTPGNGLEYVLVNLDSGLEVAARVRIAGDSAARRQGLRGVRSLERDAGLWIMPCEAIHTFGLRIPIDVLFLDRDFTVRKLHSGMPPWRISVCLRASSVVEMRAGVLADSNTKVGDRLAVARAGRTPDGTLEEPMRQV